MARLGVSPLNPTDYTGIKQNLVPVVEGQREPTINDTRYNLWTEWRVGANPTSGAEGDWWKLVKFSGSQAIWVKISTGTTGAVLSQSDTSGTKVFPDSGGNIQLTASSGLTITSDAANNLLTFALAGGGVAIDQIDVDFNTAPGIDPVNPTAAGLMSVYGNVVINGTNASAPVATHSRALNQYHVEVQLADDRTGAPGNNNDVGLASFNDTQFILDGNAYASLVGGTDLPAVQTLTGDSGGAIGPDASGDIAVVGGTGVTVTGTTNTITIDSSEAEVAKVGVSNLGIKLSAGTFSIVSADGTDLTSSNKGYVTLPSVATPGTLITISVEDNHEFVDDAGTSTVAGMLWGTTINLDWANDMPFFIYAIMNDADDEVAFGITRSPAMGASYATANIGASGTIVTTGANTLFLMDLETGPTTPTIAEYDTNPSLLVGSFRMTKTSTTSNDWTVSALADSDGIGRFQAGTQWTFPTGQNGSTSGTYFQSTTSTQPTFSSGRSTYHLLKNGIVKYVLEQNTAVAGVGAGLLEPTLPVACLTNSGADAYTNCRHSLAATTVRNVYTGTINGAAQFCTGLYKANSTTTLTNAIIATSDEFTFHAIYPGFN